jgi:hypothetical protein
MKIKYSINCVDVRLQSVVTYIYIGSRTVIPHSEKVATKPPYVCPGCLSRMYNNNIINRCHVR